MKVVTLDHLLKISDVFLRPYIQYVLSDSEAVPIYQREYRQWGKDAVLEHCTLSALNPYERRYGGQDANGKHIALYRHYAFGDSLIASAVPRYLKFLWPHCQIDFYAHPEMFNFWKGNKYIRFEVAIPIPMQLEALRRYDYHILYEGMLESNSEPNQGNCYDDMFAFCGLQDVPSRFKRPCIFISPEDYAAVDYLREVPHFDLNCKYLVYHLSPANENRCYPLRLSRIVWELFLESFPDWKIYVVGLDPDHLRNRMFEGLPEDRCINLLSKFKDFRHLIPLLENAGLVICPDSAVGHMAACFPSTPVISLWGLFSPEDRVKYYPNHYPLWHPEVCKYAPCHNHEFEIPSALCKKGAQNFNQVIALSLSPERAEWCAVLAAISPEEIVGHASKIIEGYRKEEHGEMTKDKDSVMPRLEKGEIPDVRLEDLKR